MKPRYLGESIDVGWPRDEARRFAEQFSTTHPTSTYVSRMRSMLER